MSEEAEALNQEQEAPESPAQERGFSLLASELFGSNYKGEVKETPEPEPERESEPSSEVEETETPEETTEGEEVEEPSEEETEEPISSLSDLIEHQEWDPEWVDNLKVPVKVDGKPAEATLKDLRDSYQIQEAAKHRLDEAKVKAQEANQQIAQERESLKAELGAAVGLVRMAEQLFGQDESALEKLGEEHGYGSDEYHAAKHDLDKRKAALEQVKGQLRDNVLKAVREQNQKPTDEDFAQAQQALLQRVPALEKQEERARLADYVSRSFTEEELAANTDPRLYELAWKAMLYDETKAKTNAAKKKVAKVPKVLKPGAPKPQEQINRERITEAKSRLQKSGSLDDAYAVLKARRGG